MAKKKSKRMATTLQGSLLPQGEASTMNQDYLKRMLNAGAVNLPNMPQAVCYTIAELRAYLESAEQTINANGLVPPEQAGIAIMPGFKNNKVTYMLVATRFTENKLTQSVLAINNVVTGIHPSVYNVKAKKGMKMTGDGDPEPPVGDDSYDSGSTWP